MVLNQTERFLMRRVTFFDRETTYDWSNGPSSVKSCKLNGNPPPTARKVKLTRLKIDANVEHNTAKGIQVRIRHIRTNTYSSHSLLVPSQLQNVKSAPSSWNWRYVSQSSGIRADVAYDIWTGVPSSGSPASSASSYEM